LGFYAEYGIQRQTHIVANFLNFSKRKNKVIIKTENYINNHLLICAFYGIADYFIVL